MIITMQVKLIHRVMKLLIILFKLIKVKNFMKLISNLKIKTIINYKKKVK